MKKLIYFIPLLLIGCKEAPKDYYSAREVEIIEPIEYTTNIDNSTDTATIEEVKAYLDSINKTTPLRHMINPEETAPHTVKIRVIK